MRCRRCRRHPSDFPSLLCQTCTLLPEVVMPEVVPAYPRVIRPRCTRCSREMVVTVGSASEEWRASKRRCGVCRAVGVVSVPCPQCGEPKLVKVSAASHVRRAAAVPCRTCTGRAGGIASAQLRGGIPDDDMTEEQVDALVESQRPTMPGCTRGGVDAAPRVAGVCRLALVPRKWR
jgi:hypothetical protein